MANKAVFQSSFYFSYPHKSAAGAVITITDSATGAHADLWEDLAGTTEKSNPFLVPNTAFVKVYMNPGQYDIVVSDGFQEIELLDFPVGVAGQGVNDVASSGQVGADDYAVVLQSSNSKFYKTKVSALAPVEAGSCDIFTSDEYWEPAESFYDYTWTGSQWERPFEEDSTFNFVFLPVGAWKSGYRKPILNLTLGSGEDTNSGGFLSAINVILYDDQLPPNEIGSGSVNFESYEQTKDLQIELSFGDFDIGFIELQTFLYSTGPIISKIEFCDE